MGRRMIACETIKEELFSLQDPELEISFLEYALHRTPERLQKTLQEAINGETGCDTILLGYGLCSNGISGLTSPDKWLVIPRVHDCISLLLGSRERYQEEFARHPGTIYLSKGWIDAGGDPYRSLQKYTEKYGEETARWILHQEYKNYERLAFIHTPVGDLEPYRQYARKAAQAVNLSYVELEGSLALLQALLQGEWGECVVIPPGKIVIPHPFHG